MGVSKTIEKLRIEERAKLLRETETAEQNLRRLKVSRATLYRWAKAAGIKFRLESRP
jgi:predicted site-specific integrase-resolvase